MSGVLWAISCCTWFIRLVSYCLAKGTEIVQDFKNYVMETTQSIGNDRVRKATPDSMNEKIDQKTEANIRHYTSADAATLRERIDELDKEWDIERTLELNASLVALGGVILAATVSKKWLF